MIKPAHLTASTKTVFSGNKDETTGEEYACGAR
jgi:hypothetical protein